MEAEKNGIVCEPKSFKLAFKNDTPANIAEINEEILDSVRKYGIKAVLAYTKKGRAVTIAELADNGVTENIPDDGAEIVKVLTFDFKDETLFVLEQHAAIPLSRLKLTVSYRKGDLMSGQTAAPDPKLDEEDDYTADVFIKIKEPT